MNAYRMGHSMRRGQMVAPLLVLSVTVWIGSHEGIEWDGAACQCVKRLFRGQVAGPVPGREPWDLSRRRRAAPSVGSPLPRGSRGPQAGSDGR
ncbi:hypothetical protein GY45DRAFT_487880 [Cubamyces sp. BRFM 1775]|nr:hypothetical protein GY45DRAFT_487880 [Cubamyces sp. BRFM 1775]